LTSLSGWSFKCIFAILKTNSCQEFKFALTRLLLKEMSSGLVLKHYEAVVFFFQTILYKLGYCSFKVVAPSYISSQNLIWLLPCNLKFPKLRNWSLTFISPVQNCELPSFLFTWVMDLPTKHLFLMSCWHVSSPFIKLKSHLLSRLLFCFSRSSTPSSPKF
jgi:hypothetical protein